MLTYSFAPYICLSAEMQRFGVKRKRYTIAVILSLIDSAQLEMQNDSHNDHPDESQGQVQGDISVCESAMNYGMKLCRLDESAL
ncbi:hypothetical protein AO354_34205 [Pseudomonas syringae pv. syringae]|nr:hypothetical protein AO354_34205 [Pseudomonas syringae pv. syringae]